ncbi:hypothetical protein PGT21_027415 [Puccinia graminis f. sp. tritici]|uniref:Uncharacterized protein n=1 Tax=Puccinia graminis f. sp. tritici TaxID=56615 RepID=A0A5B0PH97_PUCGR|nr:hypothetical protein PGT21_027415 [Puccinia graminis f. sp. tritici]
MQKFEACALAPTAIKAAIPSCGDLLENQQTRLPISFTQQWKVLLGERNRVDNVGGKGATHQQSNGPANRAPTQPFSQPGRMGWTTVHKWSYNMAVQPLWSTPSSNQWVVSRLEDRRTSRMVPEPPTHRKCGPVVYLR